MSEKLKVGIVGSGYIALKEHLPGVRAAGGEVVALADSVPGLAAERAAENRIPKAFESAEELVADPEIDVVAICTPPSGHHATALAALAAGKHVFMEKPPTRSAAEMREVAEAAARHSRFILAGSHHPFRENVRHLRDEIAAGRLGEVYAVDCFKLRRDNAPSDDENVRQRGGICSGSSVHRIDVALFLLGLPRAKAVTARTYHHFSRRRGEAEGKKPSGLVDDSVIATIHLESGCTITLRDIHGAHMEEPNFMQCWFGELTVFGSDAGAKLHPLTLYRNQVDGSQSVSVPLVNNDLHAGHEPGYRYLFDCIRTGRKPEGSPERAVHVMEIIEAIYQSAADDGRQVML